MDKKTISIKNISNREVGIVVPELRLSRFIQPGMVIKLAEDVLEEALTFPGVPELFNSQYLVALDAEKMDELAGGYVNIPQTKEETLTEAEIVTLIEKGTEEELKTLLENATDYRKDTIISASLKCEEITYAKVKLIQKYTGKDIFTMKKQLEN